MWIARIGSEPRFSPYGIHQYSWVGRVDGISGNVDMNRCFLDYPKVIVEKKFNGN